MRGGNRRSGEVGAPLTKLRHSLTVAVDCHSVDAKVRADGPCPKGVSVSGNRFVVLSNPIEGEDDTFNKWYDDVHVAEVLAVPGVVAAQRYDIAELDVPDDEDLPAQLPPSTHRYMVIYELDREPQAVMAQFLDHVMSGKMSLHETLDLSTVSLTGWTPHGERRLARH